MIGNILVGIDAYTIKGVGVQDINNQAHKKPGIGMTVRITLPQDLKTSADAQNVSFQIFSGIDNALQGGAEGGAVQVGYRVWQSSQSQAEWFAEYFKSWTSLSPDWWASGAPGSVCCNGQYRFFKAESDPNWWWIWGFYQGSTKVAEYTSASGGLTYTTGHMPFRAWMELQTNNNNPVVGTDWATPLFYLHTTRNLGYQIVTYGTAVYDGNPCPPYKSQGEEQNSSLGAQQVKVGNNQGITTACVPAGAYLFRP